MLLGRREELRLGGRVKDTLGKSTPKGMEGEGLQVWRSGTSTWVLELTGWGEVTVQLTACRQDWEEHHGVVWACRELQGTHSILGPGIIGAGSSFP